MLSVHWHLSDMKTNKYRLHTDSPAVHMADLQEMDSGNWYTDGYHSRNSATVRARLKQPT